MKEKINNIVFIASALIIFLGMTTFIIKKPVLFSETENRYLNQIPKFNLHDLASGKLISKYEDYINDQFPLRDSLVGIKTMTEVLLGKKLINDIYIAKDGYLIPSFKKLTDSNKLIEVLNTFNENVDIPVSLLLAPCAIDIYPELLPVHNESESGIKEIEKIYSNVDLKTINIIDLFNNLKNTVNLYYKTDHHWTTYGAFYAYNEYLKSDGKSSKNLDEYTIKEYQKFYGTSYSKSNYYASGSDTLYLFENNNKYKVSYVMSNKETDSLYNYDYLEKKDKYSVFLDNNHALIEIDNLDNDNKENILLIKNSYGNSFATFIANDYDKLSVIDLRYYKGTVSEYVSKNNITKVLILYDINGIYSDVSIYKLK